MKNLIALGVPTQEVFQDLLMDLGRTRDRKNAHNLIEIGGDVASAMNQLIANSQDHLSKGEHEVARAEQDAANALAMVLAMSLLPKGPSNPNKFA